MEGRGGQQPCSGPVYSNNTVHERYVLRLSNKAWFLIGCLVNRIAIKFSKIDQTQHNRSNCSKFNFATACSHHYMLLRSNLLHKYKPSKPVGHDPKEGHNPTFSGSPCACYFSRWKAPQPPLSLAVSLLGQGRHIQHIKPDAGCWLEVRLGPWLWRSSINEFIHCLQFPFKAHRGAWCHILASGTSSGSARQLCNHVILQCHAFYCCAT